MFVEICNKYVQPQRGDEQSTPARGGLKHNDLLYSTNIIAALRLENLRTHIDLRGPNQQRHTAETQGTGITKYPSRALDLTISPNFTDFCGQPLLNIFKRRQFEPPIQFPIIPIPSVIVRGFW